MTRQIPDHKTPLMAAFFVSMVVLSACSTTPKISHLFSNACERDSIPISTVQGSSSRSPMLGEKVLVRGIVTFSIPATGIFLEQPLADLSPATSDAIFVRSEELGSSLEDGMLVAVSGIVNEIGSGSDTQTSLDPITDHKVCGTGMPVPNSDARLPLHDSEREAMENMRVTLIQPLFLTDVYRLSKGQLTLSADDILWQPTEIHPPGEAATEARLNNQRNSIPVQLKPEHIEAHAVGSPVPGITGVLGHDGYGLRLQADEVAWSPPAASSSMEKPDSGILRVVGFNLENYFNGDGLGGGFPTERGAQSPQGFLRQRGRLSETIRAMSPHLLAVMELENDGFGHNSAAHDLVHAISGLGEPVWSVVQPPMERIGGDVITVGMFYQGDTLQAQGPARVLDTPEFNGLSRQPLAQVFRHIDSGQRFLVAVNHFKSKGSCPGSGVNADQGDGQGCWNPARLQAAKALTGWLQDLAAAENIDDILILGDLNAFRREQPIQAIADSGFTDLVAASNMNRQPSYVYRGAAGTLDYAFATESLAKEISSTQVWRINSVWPANMPLPQPWLHSSDHDPVIIDFRPSQSAERD
jgi:predicted extracellular nuclease